MPRYVAFLRAVNVPGRTVKMAELRERLSESGFRDVDTHIQSGNVAVSSSLRSADAVGTRIAGVIEQWRGFEVPTIVRTLAEVSALVDRIDGIPALLSPPGKRYVVLLRTPLTPEAGATLAGWDAPGERIAPLGTAALGEFGVPFHTIRLTGARLERMAGTAGTWRDLGVLRAIAEKWGR